MGVMVNGVNVWGIHEKKQKMGPLLPDSTRTYVESGFHRQIALLVPDDEEYARHL